MKAQNILLTHAHSPKNSLQPGPANKAHRAHGKGQDI
jgi:hypothetical protein